MGISIPVIILWVTFLCFARKKTRSSRMVLVYLCVIFVVIILFVIIWTIYYIYAEYRYNYVYDGFGDDPEDYSRMTKEGHVA